MAARNISLSEHYDRFVGERVESRRHQNASEVVRAALCLLEFKEEADAAKLSALQKTASDAFKALDRGEYDNYHAKDFWHAIESDLNARRS